MTAYTACITSRGKNCHLYVPRPSFVVCPGDVAITQNVAWMKRQFSACQTPRSMYLSIFKSFRVIRCLSRCVSPKIAIFTYRSPHFCFPWRRPAIITQYVAWMKRQFSACQTLRSMYLSIFNSFRVIRCLSQCVCQKIAIFYHILVSPGDAPGAITLNVVSMEKEFDAYKLSCWMCPSNYNRFWDRAIYLSKIVIFSYPIAFDAPIRGVPVGTSPLRLVWEN